MSRRQLLAIAGGAGLVATAAALTKVTASGPVAGPSALTATPTPVSSPPQSLSAEPLSSAAPAPSAPPRVMFCREAWGAEPARAGGKPHTINRMTIHHTGAVLGDNSNAPGRLLQHQRLHQGERGWIDIAYHVSVDRNGNIYELRNTDFAGDTATDYNTTNHFLVLCEGDFNQESVTDAQLDGAAYAFAWATQKWQIADDMLGSHRDFASTSCPGENLFARVASGELRGRIDDLLTGGTVDLQTICGPEAKAQVEAIEAGR